MELIRVTDPALVRRWHAVEAAALAHDFVALPADPDQEVAARLDGGDEGGQRFEFWLGTEGGADVVAAKLTLPTLDNLDEAQVRVLVHPAVRRRGHGETASREVGARCATLGRTRVIVEVPGRLDGVPLPSEALVERLGFTPRLTSVRRVLDLTTLDLDALASLEAAAWPAAEGYTLRGWVDQAPTGSVAGLAALSGRMTLDAPMGDLEHEPEVDRWLAREQATAKTGRTRVGTMALAGGEVVGYTDIGVSRFAPTVGYQWDTIVRADHRGHRLGLLMKAANLRLLAESSPVTRWVNTWNAASNAYMISINETIGWRPAERWTEWQRDL
jgi:GNAT superfamily N-acetyltransferase